MTLGLLWPEKVTRSQWVLLSEAEEEGQLAPLLDGHCYVFGESEIHEDPLIGPLTSVTGVLGSQGCEG